MKRVLVIEDDKNIALALTVRLRAHGYEAQVAYDATSAVSAATRFRPNVILLDISMPGGGGLVAAQRLRNLTPLATIPIIFLTASKKPGLREEALALGAAEFFEKPYDPAELMVAIARALDPAVAAPAHAATPSPSRV